MRQLTNDAVQDGNPVWSQTAQQVAFYKATDREGTGYHLWLVNSNGTGACNTMPGRPGKNMDPSWTSTASGDVAWAKP